MAQRFNVVTGAIATGTAAKTLVQVVAAANHSVDFLGFSLSFDGVASNATRGTWRLLRQTTAGTMSALTPVKGFDSNADAIDATALHTATAEPTAGDVLDSGYVDPMYGFLRYYPEGQIVIGASDRLGLEVTFGTGVNARAAMFCRE